jgi:hypothetical protein
MGENYLPAWLEGRGDVLLRCWSCGEETAGVEDGEEGTLPPWESWGEVGMLVWTDRGGIAVTLDGDEDTCNWDDPPELLRMGTGEAGEAGEAGEVGEAGETGETRVLGEDVGDLSLPYLSCQRCDRVT